MTVRSTLSACVLLCAAVAFADDKKDEKKAALTARAIGVSVNRKVDAKLADQFQLGKIGHGTSVDLLVRSPVKPLLGVEKWEKLTVKDDKGNLLNDPKDLSGVSFVILTQTSFDRTAMTVPVQVDSLPGKGATKVRLEGKLIALCGTGEKTIESKKFDFAQGKAKFGDFEVKVVGNKGIYCENGRYRIGSGELAVRSDAFKIDVVKGISVKDADGKTVEVARHSAGGHRLLGGATHFVFTTPHKQGTLALTYFSKSETVEVPIDVSVGLGE
jgi:hypothetical protein